jgi:hypothetical protein
MARDENVQRMLLPWVTAEDPAPCPGIELLVTSDLRTKLMNLQNSVPIDEWVDEAYFNKLNPNSENLSFLSYDESTVTLAKEELFSSSDPVYEMEKWTTSISIRDFKQRYPENIIVQETTRDAKESPGKVHIIGTRVVFGRPGVSFERFKDMLTADEVVMGITVDGSSVEVHDGTEAIERLVSRVLSLESYE